MSKIKKLTPLVEQVYFNPPQEAKLTPRQLEGLTNLFLGDQFDAQRSQERHSWIEGDDTVHIPRWGRRAQFGYTHRKGGANFRMKMRLAENGYLTYTRSKYSGEIQPRNVLTAKALKALREAYPELPDIDARLAKREAEEKEEARKLEAEKAENQKLREEQRKASKAARRERMAEILKEHGVNHDLNGDQLEEMMNRITEAAMAL